MEVSKNILNSVSVETTLKSFSSTTALVLPPPFLGFNAHKCVLLSFQRKFAHMVVWAATMEFQKKEV